MDDHYAIKLSQGERWFLFTVPLVITAAIVAIAYWAVPHDSGADRTDKAAAVQTIAEQSHMPPTSKRP
jgi:hypothetical protein